MRKLLLLAILMLVVQTVFAQNRDVLSKKISISFHNEELATAIMKIQEQTGLPFAYNNKLPGMDKKISRDFENKSIKFILDALLKEEQLEYRIVGNQITIFKPKPKEKERKLKSGAIEGKIINAESKEPLPFINLAIEGESSGGITNLKGLFYISGIPAGIKNLQISAIGYEPRRIDNIEIPENLTINLGTIELLEGAISLKEVVVSPGSFAVMSSAPPSMQTLGERDLKYMSFSEDITRAVTRLPGVSSNDYSSKFTVRGGETDEVLITLDGMELYDPFHQRDFAGGLFSIVDIETIKGIELLTGGFSAEFGTRQSGVFNMFTKTTSDNQRLTSFGVSAINVRAYTQGTFHKNRGSYLLSVRRGLLDQTIRLAGNNQEIPVYYDMFGKIAYSLNEKHKISFHILEAADKTRVRDITIDTASNEPLIDTDTVSHIRLIEQDTITDWDISDTKYNNLYAWLTLKSTYNSHLYSRTILFAGMLTHNRNGNAYKEGFSDKVNFDLSDNRKMQFFGMKQDWTWNAHERLFLKSGLDIRKLYVDYSYSLSLGDIRVNSEGIVVDYQEDRVIVNSPSGQQTGMYLTGRIKVLSNLFVEPGFRFDYISYTNEKQWSPRFSFVYALTKRTFFRGGWGHYYQSQLINHMQVNFGVDHFLKAEMAEHFVLGFEHQFPFGLNARLEGYYKDISLPSTNYQNLRDPWEVFPEARNDVVKLNISGARAKGIELFLKYDVGSRISWWFSYALAVAEEQVDSLEFNGLLDKQSGWLPRVNNQNHTVYTDLIYRFNKSWVGNLSWQFWTGWPLTVYEYKYVWLDDGRIHYYPHHTLFRGENVKPYHRLDLRISKQFNLKLGQLDTYIQIINVYNRKNVKKYDRDVVNDNEQLVPDGQGGYITHESYSEWMGIIPTFGVSWQF